MQQHTFVALNGRKLIVKHKKSAVILEVADLEANEEPMFQFNFSEGNFKSFVSYMELIANEVWSTFTPKDATSEASDYYEYYDKEFDNNGFLSIGEKHIFVEGPHTTTGRLYQFNKAKMQSFIFDLKKQVS
jgi:hypothetical protein